MFVCPDGSASEPVDQNYVTPPVGASYCGLTNDTPAVFSFGNEGDGSTADVRQVHMLSYSLNVIPNVATAWKTLGFYAVTSNKSGYVSSGTTVGLNENQIEDPSGTIRIVDGMTQTSTAGKSSCGLGNSIRGIQSEDRTDHFKTTTSSKVAMRHSQGFVALYGDGHAKWRRYGTSTPCDWTIQDDSSQCK